MDNAQTSLHIPRPLDPAEFKFKSPPDEVEIEPPEPWNSTTFKEMPFNRSSPLKSTAPACWEECWKSVNEFDNNMCKVWKDDIDHLLIFAGLFSATVTPFAVESYQWLDTSSNTAPQLLAQLIALQLNTTTPLAAITPAGPSPSTIRINVYWFLSLVLSLIAVVVGILCLQWLREYERPHSGSFEEKLRYRQIRYDGLVAWGVPSLIPWLPFLVVLSLILFFVGVVELLWERNHIVASIILVPITLLVLFLIDTSYAPALQAIKIRWSLNLMFTGTPRSQCPYKSPLSYSTYIAVLPILEPLSYWKKLLDDLLGFQPSRPSLWTRFDELWTKDKPGRALAKSILWMKDEFAKNSTAISSVYDCFKVMDSDTARAVVEELEGEFQGILPQRSFLPLRNLDTSSAFIRDVTRIINLEISGSQRHRVLEQRLKDRIGLALQDPIFLPAINDTWDRDVALQRRGEFAEQILMCTLRAMSNPDIPNLPLDHVVSLVDSAISSSDRIGRTALLRMNYDQLKAYICNGPPGAVRERARCVWKGVRPSWFKASSRGAQLHFVDLIWTTIKRGEIRPENSTGYLHDAYLDIFKLSSWDIVHSTPEEDPALWWVNALPGREEILASSDGLPTAGVSRTS
ncbi:hypothetical protein BDN72DRAFT_847241 [Pluteus cervinus]|uniref:Uncharacterized protein n=1 Tax=Pluteus cervinus TaxID=181527 RepID=A0ACD3AEG3_9AGAR|nr:hypothetical protein BDN72DRAFT_847241 [Pluteus cervinus]